MVSRSDCPWHSCYGKRYIDAASGVLVANLGHGRGHLAEIGDLQVVPLAGGLDLELFFVFSDGGAAAADRGTPSWTSISGAVALVGAGCGHMGKVTFG